MDNIQGNGSTSVEEVNNTVPETQTQIDESMKKLKSLTGSDGQLVTLGVQELSLMHKMLSTGSETYKELEWWRMCDFEDTDESLDHLAAYFEAKRLHMDMDLNVSYAFAMSSVNRRGHQTNLLGAILDTLQHGKWASSPQPKREGGTRGRIGR